MMSGVTVGLAAIVVLVAAVASADATTPLCSLIQVWAGMSSSQSHLAGLHTPDFASLCSLVCCLDRDVCAYRCCSYC